MSNLVHSDTRASLRSDSFSSFIYFVNFVLRNVIVTKSIGHIHDGRSLSFWLDQNGFRTVFEFSSKQVSKLEIQFLSKLRSEVIVAYNPFDDMDLAEIEKTLKILDLCDSALIIAVFTALNCEYSPKVAYSIFQWKQILSQIGNVVDIHTHDTYQLFLVTKHG